MRLENIILIVLLVTGNCARAQQQFIPTEHIFDKVKNYKYLTPSDVLFVHTDKNIYTNNETIWFSAYLLRSDSTASHTILTVSLVKEDSRRIELVKNHNMADGLSFGSITLPDSIPPGSYQFIATTNVFQNGLPRVLYQQSISVKSIRLRDFSASVTVTPLNPTAQTINVLISVENKASKLRERPEIEYRISDGTAKKAVMKDNTLSIPVSAQNASSSESVFYAKVTWNNQTQYLSAKIPTANSSPLSVKFFPEGGNLVTGIESRIGWEAHKASGNAVRVSAVLYEDDTAKDTCYTDMYGFGSFLLKPIKGRNYHLKIVTDSILAIINRFQLPKPLSNGVVIRVPQAVVNDTLRFTLQSQDIETVQVLVHNFKNLFASFETQINPTGRAIKVALPSLPKGIAAITIVDKEGRPLAERIFFAHHNHGLTAQIKTNKKEYARREKIKVSIQVNDHKGMPVQAIISLAAVQSNRVETAKEQDIESYLYLNHDLGRLPNSPSGQNFQDIDYLENIFLIRSWRRYTWTDLMKSDHDIQSSVSPKFPGIVKYNNRNLKNPVPISIAAQSQFDVLTTTKDGSFQLDPRMLIINDNQKVILSVNHKSKEGYTIQLEDPFLEGHRTLAKSIQIGDVGYDLTTTDRSLTGMERMIGLEEVVVVGSNNSSNLYATAAIGANACGDYVDEWGYLNYPYSANNSKRYQPVKGKEYKIRTDLKGDGPGKDHIFTVRSIIYEGCTTEKNQGVFKFDGIYLTKEFYGVSPLPELASEPQFLSTLLWQPGILTNDAGWAELDFLAGDITGEFRVIIQGINNQYVVHSSETFTVK